MLPQLLLAGLLVGTPPATPPPVEVPRISALRITPAHGIPKLDGRLDDAVWMAADSLSDFIQVEPRPGEPSAFRTVARLAYDDAAVYVAVRAFDAEPKGIAAQLTRRDEESSSDWLYIGFDSHHDRRTAYVFGVNPVGVKRDFMISNDSESDDKWDSVWEVEARADGEGWTAEFRIPLSALRFSTGGDGVWGFQVVREVQRVAETSAWSAYREDEPRVVSRFGELAGMHALRPPRRLEVLPYVVSNVTRAPGAAENPFYSANSWGNSAGVDIKYGLSSNLTLDATVNPDFGQVEADPSQVNLSAYETFFPEKRPFFTEGADIFRFGIALGDGDDANEQLFYSRRIGRAPQGSADGRGGYVDAPEQTTILGAAKLSGRVPGGWSVGVLSALTDNEMALVSDSLGIRHQGLVEPLTNYSVVRARRDLNEGDTQIGTIGTGVIRDVDGTEMGFLRSSAFAGGIDFSHRFRNDDWLATGWLLGSHIRGSTEAILDAQLSSARYLQRPDADYLEVDSSATSMSGWAANYGVMKIAGGHWRGGFIGQIRSPGFEVNDLGYQRDADQIINVGFLGYRDSEPGPLFRSFNVNINGWTGRNFGWDNTGMGGNINGWGEFRNFWSVYGGVNRNFSSLATRALRGGPAIRDPGAYNGWWGFRSDERKPFHFGVNGNWRIEEESGSRFFRIGIGPNWRVSASSQLSLSPFFMLNRDRWQYVDTPTDGLGDPHYVFGELDQKTVGMSARVNQTFTPELSFQLFAQPFISTGRFGEFKEVRDPRAQEFADRFDVFAPEMLVGSDGETVAVDLDGDREPEFDFDDPDFSVRDLNLTAVLRWEYRMGSTLFFVWSHGRGGNGVPGEFRPLRDFEELFREPSTNVFLIKANWWLNL